jgi:hypothetical protein
MKKLTFLLIVSLLITISACNPSTTVEPTTNATTTVSTTAVTTVEVTTAVTTIFSDEISIRLNSGVDTVEINGEWIDNGSDLIINGGAHPMVKLDTVDVSIPGIYIIHYAYTHGETVYEIDRYVMVIDQTPPVLTLNLGIDTILVGEEWIDESATVIDNSNEAIEIVVTGTVNTSVAGTYEITYTASDSSGNTSSIKRFVTVYE